MLLNNVIIYIVFELHFRLEIIRNRLYLGTVKMIRNKFSGVKLKRLVGLLFAIAIKHSICGVEV